MVNKNLEKKRNKRFLTSVHGKIGKAIRRFGLIENGDKIVIAISGGKDSLILLENLAFRKKYTELNFELRAAHVDITNIEYVTDIEYLTKFCSNLEVPLTILRDEINLEEDSNKQLCFICAWNRRKMLFTHVNDLRYNKLAFGHHLDDAIETLLMNMMYHGSISSIPPILDMFKGTLKTIRPLILSKDAELKRYSEIRVYTQQLKQCPHSNKTRRDSTRKLIDEMEKMNSTSRVNIFNSMNKIFQEYIVCDKINV